MVQKITVNKRPDADGWICYHTFHYPDGVAKMRNKTFGIRAGVTTENQALRLAEIWVKETQEAIDKGRNPKAKNYTLRKFIDEEWMKIHEEHNASENRYISALKNPVLKPLMAIPLKQLEYPTLSKFFYDMGHRKIKNRRTGKMQYPKIHYLQNYKKALSSVLNLARKHHIVDRNEVRDVNLKDCLTKEAIQETGSRSSQRNSYEIEQLNVIFNEIEKKDPQYYRMCKIMVSLGLRTGELSALDLNESINFRDKTILINKSMTHTPEKGTHSKGTKTDKARVIHFNNEVEKILIEQLQFINAQDDKLSIRDTEHFWLFSYAKNKNQPFKPARLGIKWTKFTKNLEVPHYDFYSLRHTFATQMLSSGFDPAVIAAHMGHTVETFFRYYAHSLDSKLKELGEFDMFKK